MQEEKQIKTRLQNILQKITKSKTLRPAIKVAVLSAFLSGKAMNSEAATIEVRDAETNRIEMVSSKTPGITKTDNAKWQKMKSFSEIPELSLEDATFVDHTYIIDHNAWMNDDSIVVKCVDLRHVQDISLTDIACSRECHALPKSAVAEDGYVTFDRDPGVIGSDGRSTYNGMFSTDFNSSRQSIALMYCSNDSNEVKLGQQMIGGNHDELAQKIRNRLYNNDSTIVSPQQLAQVLNSSDFRILKNRVKNSTNRSAFNLMYQKVCRSNEAASVDFQEHYMLNFYGVGRVGNLYTLNEKIKEVNGKENDLTKVKPSVIGAALSEMIAKGHGTLSASDAENLRLQRLNDTSSNSSITNARVLGNNARIQADKMDQYDYLTLKMAKEMFYVTNNVSFYNKVMEKVDEHEQKIIERNEEILYGGMNKKLEQPTDAIKVISPNFIIPERDDKIQVVKKYMEDRIKNR